MESVGAILKNRIKTEPLNLVATLIFLCAIVHTFMTDKLLALARHYEAGHQIKIKEGTAHRNSMDIRAGLFHFLGEVETVFGVWAIVLGIAISVFYDWSTFLHYMSHKVNFTEPIFIVAIMTLASTRPILKLAEAFMSRIANRFGGSLAAWWITILVAGPILGSLITEPAAMTISALLLAQKLYDLEPSEKFKYATIGLLFVNVSIGGALTHFAAPPILMVAGPWDWGTPFIFNTFGWKSLLGMSISTACYYLFFCTELKNLQEKYVLRKLKDDLQETYLGHMTLDAEIDQVIKGEHGMELRQSMKEQLKKKSDEIRGILKERLLDREAEYLKKKNISISVAEEAFDQRFEELELLRMRENFPGLLPKDKRPEFFDPIWNARDDAVPIWVTLIHICFMLWMILNAHYAPMVVGGLLFFLAFARISGSFQNNINLKPPLLVGFFLAGLVIHGGMQAWWIAPVLGSLNEIPLMLVGTGLTAFNDNAAITYLSTLVPGLSEELKYAIVAGALSGGGLTVIANAPNPAGQSLLKKYFNHGVAPMGLLKAALFPTLVVLLVFLIL